VVWYGMVYIRVGSKERGDTGSICMYRYLCTVLGVIGRKGVLVDNRGCWSCSAVVDMGSIRVP
jgi:hypothetical protein